MLSSSSCALRAVRPIAVARRAVIIHRNASGTPHWNEPTGNLFGEEPLAPGQKRVKEPWENIWYFGMFGSMAVAVVGLYYKPDTSIDTWALQEAKARMQARGELPEYKSTAQTSS